MLIFENNTYRFRCDADGKESERAPTLAALITATHFGNSLKDEPPGWTNGLGQLQVTGDESVFSDQYKWKVGPVSSGIHICPGCRGLFNLYHAIEINL